ncbi:MAG: DUF4129 domain-containing protein [Actinobacteria bacterium]|nr:DUF4129 domain-containing protein [Actinomycetota bacterium]
MPDRTIAGFLAGLVVVLLVAAPTARAPAAASEDVTATELAELARRAADDPAARRELAEVQRVDGRPVDLSTALSGADDAEQRARLRTLAEAVGSSGPAAAAHQADARADARRILDGRRYNAAEPPRPLRGVLRKLGDWLRALTRPVAERLPSFDVPAPFQAVLALAVLGLAIAVATRLVRRRAAEAVGEERGRRRAAERSLDPQVLDRQADEAERRGDLDAAVRLRFRAGLVRLDAAGAIELRPSLTTGEVRRRVRSDALYDLTTTFEAVAYAGEPAGADDVAAARRDWPRVLAEVGRR